jgi:hypothetical protein
MPFDTGLPEVRVDASEVNDVQVDPLMSLIRTRDDRSERASSLEPKRVKRTQVIFSTSGASDQPEKVTLPSEAMFKVFNAAMAVSSRDSL